jgi:hypothetical protein
MAGVKPFYENVEDLQNAIDSYFTSNQGKITLTGLALHLGFESRQSVYDYEKKGEFSYTIKKARLRVENYYELELLGDHTSGAIFALKNFGWADNQNVNVKTENMPFKPIDLDVITDHSTKED